MTLRNILTAAALAAIAVILWAHFADKPSAPNTRAQEQIKTCAQSVNTDYDPSTCAGVLQEQLQTK